MTYISCKIYIRLSYVLCCSSLNHKLVAMKLLVHNKWDTGFMILYHMFIYFVLLKFKWTWIRFCHALYCLYRDIFVHVPSQWEMVVHYNTIFNWLGPCTKWSQLIKLNYIVNLQYSMIHLYWWWWKVRWATPIKSVARCSRKKTSSYMTSGWLLPG